LKRSTTKTNARTALRIAGQVNLFALHVNQQKTGGRVVNVKKTKFYLKMTFAFSAVKLMIKYFDAKTVKAR